MSKNQEKSPKKVVEKPKVAKKPKNTTPKNDDQKVKKVIKPKLNPLQAHAQKHIANWHSKAGENGPEFLKQVQKYTRSLLKTPQKETSAV